MKETEQDIRLQFKNDTGKDHSEDCECNTRTDKKFRKQYTLWLEEQYLTLKNK